jgi:hypothetical protein
MIWKNTIANVLIILLLACSFAFVPASAVSVNLGSTDPGLFERVDALSQYGIENWTNPESPIYDPAVFKAYGKVLPIHNATQLNDFAYNLRSVRESSWDEIEFYPNGHVVRYGGGPDRGYFLVELYDDGTAYSEKHTQKIYDIVDKYALEKGIQNVPVAFTLTKDTSIIGFVEFPVYLYDIDDSSAGDGNNSYFKYLKGDLNFIASRGTLPEIMDTEWNNSIQNCWLNVKGISYLRFDQSIRNIEFRDGVSVVKISPAYNGQMNESRINEMYQKIESYCEEKKGISDIPVVFMWAEDEDYVTLEHDSDAFENAKYDPYFIASRGSVPIFANEGEWTEWSIIVFEARNIDELNDYLSNSSLESYGFNSYTCYIQVDVNRTTSEKINDSFINDTYQIIAEHYEKEGISDVPVVFMWYEPVIGDTPGFTSLMLLLSLLLLAGIQRKLF